jgi:glycosyltransferase involved in cell wall biosynthesis
VLPVTAVLAGHVRREGVPADRIVVIPNGVDPRLFPEPATAGVVPRRAGLGSRIVLGFTGFVRAWHGLERVVDLVAAHGARLDLHLLIVGDGPGLPAVRARAAALGVEDRLTVTGVVAGAEIPGWVAAFDVALQPALTPYASPLKLFEYMILGRAVVAPDTPNIREVLTAGHDALLFTPEAPAALERAILALCEDAGLRARLGRQARRTILEHPYTWAHNAARVAALAAGNRPCAG